MMSCVKELLMGLDLEEMEDKTKMRVPGFVRELLRVEGDRASGHGMTACKFSGKKHQALEKFVLLCKTGPIDVLHHSHVFVGDKPLSTVTPYSLDLLKTFCSCMITWAVSYPPSPDVWANHCIVYGCIDFGKESVSLTRICGQSQPHISDTYVLVS